MVKVVRPGIAGPIKAMTVPVHAVTDCPVRNVQRGKVLDGHAIFLIGDAGIQAIIEFRDFQILSFSDIQTGFKSRPMPLR